MDNNSLKWLGILALAGGAGFLAYHYTKGKISGTVALPQPAGWNSSPGVVWPPTGNDVVSAIQQLDKVWWTQWQSLGARVLPSGTSSWTTLMIAASNDASLIRSQYGAAGVSIPATGYSCSELVAAGVLPSGFPCPSGS